MNHNPFDFTTDHFARALILNIAGTAGWSVLFRSAVRDCYPVCVAVRAYRFNDNPLQLLRADASDGTSLLLPALQHRLAHIISVASALAGGMARRHPVAPIIKYATHKQPSAFGATLSLFAGMDRELRLDGLPQSYLDDGFMLTRMRNTLMDRLAAIDPVPQQVIERPATKGPSPDRAAGFGDTVLTANTQPIKLGL